MKRCLFYILLTLALCLILLPAAALADEVEDSLLSSRPRTLTIGKTSINTGENSEQSGSGWSYFPETNTLVLKGYDSGDYGERRAIPTVSYSYCYFAIYSDGDLNIELQGTNKINMGSTETDYENNRYMNTTDGNNFKPGYAGIGVKGNLKIIGTGSLETSVGTYAIITSGALTVEQAKLNLNATRDCCLLSGGATFQKKADVTATATGNQLPYYGIVANGTLTVNDATVTGITFGKEFSNWEDPAGIRCASLITVENGGKLIGTSTNDAGHGIYCGALTIKNNGEVYGNANGENSRYGIYTGGSLTVDQTSYLHAKTESKVSEKTNNNTSIYKYGAVRCESLIETAEGSGATYSYITKPRTYAYLDSSNGNYQITDISQTAVRKGSPEVEITGIRNCYLHLNSYYSSYFDSTSWYYLFGSKSLDSYGYTYSKVSGNTPTADTALDLSVQRQEKLGSSSITTIREPDVSLCKGIIVDSGSHTLILPTITRSDVTDASGNLMNPLSDTFITVKSGATLTLQLNGRSYLEHHDAQKPLITVESGGTLNIELAPGCTNGSLTLVNDLGRAIEGASGANINIKSGVVFAGDYTTVGVAANDYASMALSLGEIGGAGCNLTISGGYINANLRGYLTINGGTITPESKYNATVFSETITVNGGNVGLQIPPGVNVVNSSNTPIYRTEVTLLRAIDLLNAERAVWTEPKYRFCISTSKIVENILPVIQRMDLDKGGTKYDYKLTDLYGTSVLGDGSSSICLYLPAGVTVNEVLIQTDLTQAGTGQENNPFVSDLGDSIMSREGGTSGTLTMRTMVLGKWITALRAYPEAPSNLQMCPVYDANDDTKNLWYTYDPDKDMTFGNVSNNDNVRVEG